MEKVTFLVYGKNKVRMIKSVETVKDQEVRQHQL